MAGIKIIKLTEVPEKSIDGKGGIQRGTFYVGGQPYENATLVNGIVYDQNGIYVGPQDA